MRIQCRRATAEDLDTAADILDEATEWAAERGFESWPSGAFRDPDGWGRRVLGEALQADGLFLIQQEQATVGTFSLLPADERFWPGAPPEAMYLHRFAVRRSASGTGVGAVALAWCEQETQRLGRRFLRLDCRATEPGIRRYYERAGFEYRGDVAVNLMALSLYEKDLTAD
jgi:GNAT superfamily N-acetyltransferase